MALIILLILHYQEKDSYRCCFRKAGKGSHQGQWPTYRKHPTRSDALEGL